MRKAIILDESLMFNGNAYSLLVTVINEGIMLDCLENTDDGDEIHITLSKEELEAIHELLPVKQCDG